jgi:hypothetical protein
MGLNVSAGGTALECLQGQRLKITHADWHTRGHFWVFNLRLCGVTWITSNRMNPVITHAHHSRLVQIIKIIIWSATVHCQDADLTGYPESAAQRSSDRWQMANFFFSSIIRFSTPDYLIRERSGRCAALDALLFIRWKDKNTFESDNIH